MRCCQVGDTAEREPDQLATACAGLADATLLMFEGAREHIQSVHYLWKTFCRPYGGSAKAENGLKTSSTSDVNGLKMDRTADPNPTGQPAIRRACQTRIQSGRPVNKTGSGSHYGIYLSVCSGIHFKPVRTSSRSVLSQMENISSGSLCLFSSALSIGLRRPAPLQ